MTEEMKFFIYLLEQYAAYRNMMTGDVLREWDRKQLTQRIYDSYWGYHTERIENAFADIDSLLKTGKSAWAATQTVI
ncbi:MAG: DUF3791 domain-containing protein [Victivallales bacterium]|nr:DUF3791 domain-containing protein [Victivallales bacterium]